MRHAPLDRAVLEGWRLHQESLVRLVARVTPDQLALRAGPRLRSVGQIAAHMIGARARWFTLLMGEGGAVFKALGGWDRRGADRRTVPELIHGLETTWAGMESAIDRWTPEAWAMTWPGEAGEPETITRPWVIWHLIEHDLHHAGEISITLGAHGVRGLDL